jgi:small subunit ribosomal protein S8
VKLLERVFKKNPNYRKEVKLTAPRRVGLNRRYAAEEDSRQQEKTYLHQEEKKMQMSDVIADMLTRIRNASNAKHATVDIPASNMKKSIADILLEEGYINAVDFAEDGYNGKIVITLKYNEKKSVISGLQRVSKPGLRTYSGIADMPKVLGGLGTVILSTNKGILTGKQAKAANVGGEVLCYVW